MEFVKFKQSTGDVTEGKEYKIHKQYVEDDIQYYYFVDNANDEAIVRQVIGTDVSNFFEVITIEE